MLISRVSQLTGLLECKRCKVEKRLNNFSKNIDSKNGLQPICKSCTKEYKEEYNKTFNGFLTRLYAGQKRRSKKNHNVIIGYTKQELKVWIFSQSNFQRLWDNWVKSNYTSLLKPSCDRLDDYKGYFLSNLQLTTWEENKNKSFRDRKEGINIKVAKPVLQFDLQGKLIKKYYSILQAARENKLDDGNIVKCCKKSKYVKTVGGFVWKYEK